MSWTGCAGACVCVCWGGGLYGLGNLPCHGGGSYAVRGEFGARAWCAKCPPCCPPPLHREVEHELFLLGANPQEAGEKGHHKCTFQCMP